MKPQYVASRKRWIIYVPQGLADSGKRERKFFLTPGEAQKEINRIEEAGSSAQIVPDETDRAVLGYADLQGLTQDEHFEAIRFYKKMVKSVIKKGATLEEACVAYIANHQEEQSNRRTIYKYRSTLNRLCESLNGRMPMVELTAEKIIGIFLKRWKPGGTRLAQYRNVHALCVWACENGYLADNPLAKTKSKDKPGAHKEIVKIDEFRRILLACTEPRFNRLMPFFVLGGLAGVRRCEMISCASAEVDPRIEWTDILWSQNKIKIRQEVAKETPAKDRRRNIPLEPVVHEWLQLSGIKDKGPILDFSQSTLQREKAVLLDKLGIEDIPENALRNSYASYGTACRSPGDVARAMGDLESTVRRYYVDLVDDRATGEAWFNIRPGMDRKIIQLTATG